MAIRSELADADYGYAKVIGERLVERHRAIGGDVTMVRPFSGYGIGQSMDYPFPSIMHRAIDGEIPFKIWGDPTSCRDWIHVSDIVGAVDVLRQVPKDKRPTVVNLGTGIGVAMETLAQLAWNYAGNRPEDFRTEAVPGSPYGVHTRYADVSLMTRYWTPKVGLTAGVREYINAMT
jgi:nucleoside-diphosphate-sugar epimerase